MLRYYIQYPAGKSKDVLSLINLENRKVHHAQKNNIIGKPKDNDILVDDYVGIIDIALENIELDNFSNFKIALKPKTVAGTPLYSPPGTDVFNGYQYYNEWSRVDNAGNRYPSQPYEVWHFNNPNFDANFVWSNNNFCCTINGPDIIQPTLKYFDIPRLWHLGYKGNGIKIGILDEGVAMNFVHESFTLAGSYNSENSDGIETEIGRHAVAGLGSSGGRKGIIGSAPESTLYSANFNNVANSLSWLAQQGVRVVTMSFTGQNDDLYLNTIIKKFWKDGGVILVAAGNDITGHAVPINPLASIFGTYAIGSMVGGAIYNFKEETHSDNLLSVNGKSIDFIVPDVYVSAYCDYMDPHNYDKFYGYARGSSMSTHITAGMIACLMSAFPGVPGRIIMNMLKQHQRIGVSGTKTTDGLTAKDGLPIMDFSFVQ